ncbi:glycoside hydrolase family 125 protein [Foetidibacter luteolus]|uniref:glycoside hydrolase family 125 protein n=1 Tax=Foetidibacter luteolus TaxID=2608880 RepID=UPI00129AA32D|nr:glycoside hydrolase family 125 protein [Foetidibacter luteolus]
MQRRTFIQQSAMAGAALAFSKYSKAAGGAQDFPVVRIPEAERKFKSAAVEKAIAEVKKNIGNKEIAWLFENAFPNTLDTTVDFEVIDGKPDTYVITGDIDAMWLRDSTAQVWPYIPLCKGDQHLQELIKGVINRQVKCILLDPYANAFYKDLNKVSEWKETDITEMKPGIHERKWEIDSLCYPIRLSYGYWKTTGDTSPFDAQWKEAAKLIVKTFKEQQRFDGPGPYSFQRKTAWATDGVPLGGYGYPAKPNGLICSTFRPSDDATVFSYLIPSNFFAITILGYLTKIPGLDSAFVKEVADLQQQVKTALYKHAVIDNKIHGKHFAFEVNGFGSYNLMDDANVPSLLSLPYIDAIKANDPLYLNTRKFVLSSEYNPFYFKGKAGEGIGGPHTGVDTIWPMSIVLRGLTSISDTETKHCIDTLQKTHAGTGFIHESFHKDDAGKFTRKWFAWANTIFGEFIYKVYHEKPYLLK